MKNTFSIDQRAQIVSEECICPECEKPVAWSDIDKDWFVCDACLYSLLYDDHSHQSSNRGVKR